MSLFGELDLDEIQEVPTDGVHAAVIREIGHYESQAGNHSIKVVVEFTDEDDDFYGEKFYKYISVNPNINDLTGEEKAKALQAVRKFYLPAMRALGVPEAELLDPDFESLVGLPVDVKGAGRDRRNGDGKEWTIYSITAQD